MRPVDQAIADAERLLPGVPAEEGVPDPRWQAIIEIGESIESDPEAVWRFVARWGRHEQEDLRMAVACCLLEHLLEHHFERLFPRVQALAREDPLFAGTFHSCAKFGRSKRPENAARWDRELEREAP